jgi:hypothetical protein
MNQGFNDQRRRKRIVTREEGAQIIDGLVYHGIPVTREILVSWDSVEGAYWRKGVDAAMGLISPPAPSKVPPFAPGVVAGIPISDLLGLLPDAQPTDGLDQPTGAIPYPEFPEGGGSRG